MQFLTSLIGASGNMYLNAALALGVVVILILLGLWALKLLFRASGNIGRGGKRRLAVVDTLPVDGKRQLVIIRRDNVEHLILTGGPQDVVIETGFVPETRVAAIGPVSPARGPGRIAPTPAPAQMAPQRTPVPQRAEARETAAQHTVVAPVPPLPASPVQNPVHDSLSRLRDFNRPMGPRRSPLLRHTGLMRPVGRMEPPLTPANTDNSALPDTDSATTSRVTPFGGPQPGGGQAFGRDGSPSEQRDEGF